MTCQGKTHAETTRTLDALHNLGESRGHEYHILHWMATAQLALVCAIATRLRTHNQKLTVAAMQMALKNVCAQRSYRVAMRANPSALYGWRGLEYRT